MDERYLRSVPQVTFVESFLGQKALHGCAEMFVREKILAIGGYDLRYSFEDYPLYLKILYNYGPQPVSKDFVCCYYREHGDNLHVNHDRIYTQILRILAENYSLHPLYKTAVRAWKANWFSAVAAQSKLEALRLIPKVISLSPRFWFRLPKLFIPKKLLKF
jgi:alpha-1,3-rhamnosyltransferase